MNIAKLAIAALGATLFTTILPEDASAARIRLAGRQSYELSSNVRYYSDPPRMEGRFRRLGRGYYHHGEIRSEFIDNRSRRDSGDLSYELWALRYIGANSGPILSTQAVGSIDGYDSREDVSRDCRTKFINRRRFPDINIWEDTFDGWKFRDAFTFGYKDLL